MGSEFVHALQDSLLRSRWQAAPFGLAHQGAEPAETWEGEALKSELGVGEPPLSVAQRAHTLSAGPDRPRRRP